MRPTGNNVWTLLNERVSFITKHSCKRYSISFLWINHFSRYKFGEIPSLIIVDNYEKLPNDTKVVAQKCKIVTDPVKLQIPTRQSKYPYF